MAGVHWYVFQRGEALQDRPSGFGTISKGELHDEARLLAALDLMISVDTITVDGARAGSDLMVVNEETPRRRQRLDAVQLRLLLH